MNIRIKCEDCGRIITTRVVLSKKDVEIEIRACFHGQLHGKKVEDNGKDTNRPG